jgi:hypothetical protein
MRQKQEQLVSLSHMSTNSLLLEKEIKHLIRILIDRLCGLVVRVLGYRSGGPGSIPGTTRRNKKK